MNPTIQTQTISESPILLNTRMVGDCIYPYCFGDTHFFGSFVFDGRRFTAFPNGGGIRCACGEVDLTGRLAAAANKGPTPPPPPRRPSAYLIGSYMGTVGTWITHYANDNETVTKVEFRSLGGETIVVPPKPKPRWYEFWRFGEIDPYSRW